MDINLHTMTSTRMKLKVPAYDIGKRRSFAHLSLGPKVHDGSPYRDATIIIITSGNADVRWMDAWRPFFHLCD